MHMMNFLYQLMSTGFQRYSILLCYQVSWADVNMSTALLYPTLCTCCVDKCLSVHPRHVISMFRVNCKFLGSLCVNIM